MNGLFSLFLAAGVAAFAYSKLGRRVGYGNGRSVFIIVAVAFVLTWIVGFTFFQYVIHLS